MILSDDELNRAMALVLGWEEHSENSGFFTHEKLRQECARKGYGIAWQHVGKFQYCSDRNTLPEILDAVEKAKACDAFHNLMNELDHGWRWNTLRLSMREIVTAALKALGKMPVEGGGGA